MYFFFVLGLFWGILILLLIFILSLNQGSFVYLLDDTYIHMAMAKNFSKYGVWGINNDEFSSTSSSILYTLLLSFFYLIFGVTEIIPFIINLIFANLLIYILYILLKRNNFPSYAIFFILLLIMFSIPLFYLVFIGMEHIIQIIIFVLFVNKVLKCLSNNDFQGENESLSQNKYLFLLAPLITLIRFEGIFLIIIISLLFLMKKRFFYSLTIFLLGLLPLVIFGLISIVNGWFFFPNSIILKGNIPHITSFQDIINFFLITTLKIYEKRMLLIHLFVFLLVALIILFFQWFIKKEFWNNPSIMSIIFIIITLFQLLFAKASLSTIHYSRYDAYLIVLGIIMISFSIKNKIPNQIKFENIKKFYRKIICKPNLTIIIQDLFLITLSFFILIPIIYRSFVLTTQTPQASNNIYEQQYQMGLFLEKYYKGESIIANDIGVINYITDVKCFDLWGLSDLDVANARLENIYCKEVIAELAREKNCKIAIVYEKVLNIYGGTPANWIKVGEWSIINNIVCGDDTISFYAVDIHEKHNLIRNLKEFSSQLPSEVIQSGLYTE